MTRKEIFFFFVLLSCRDHHFPQYIDEAVRSRVNEAQVIFQGRFRALDSTSRGHYLLWMRKNQFYARIIFTKAPGRSRIHQYVHLGPGCPDLRDDKNGDRKLNFFETIASVGPVLIPLDGNLASQGEGFEWFPSTDRKGRYYYSRSASLLDLLEDLEPSSLRLRPFFAKLSPSEPLALHRRVLLIYREDQEGIWAIACSAIEVKVND